jgi:hypothetical protein
MAAHVGWRNFWWLTTGLTALNLICVIFLFPETKFKRPHFYAAQKYVNTGSPVNKGFQEEVEGTITGTENMDPEKRSCCPPDDYKRAARSHNTPGSLARPWQTQQAAMEDMATLRREHCQGILLPMVPPYLPHRRICGLRSIMDRQLLPDAQPYPDSGICSTALQF